MWKKQILWIKKEIRQSNRRESLARIIKFTVMQFFSREMLQSYSAGGQKGFVKGNYITFLSILTPPLSICILPSSSECWDKGPDPVDKLCSYMIFFFLAIHERKREKLMKAKAALVPWRTMTIMKTSYSKRRPCFHVLTGRTKRIYFTVF